METPNKLLTRRRQISFFPEPEFKPKFPKKGTLAYKALSKLIHGDHLNHALFINDTESWRLAAIIHLLKKLGWPIESYERPAKNHNASFRYISFYFLPPHITEIAIKLMRSAYAIPTKKNDVN